MILLFQKGMNSDILTIYKDSMYLTRLIQQFGECHKCIQKNISLLNALIHLTHIFHWNQLILNRKE